MTRFSFLCTALFSIALLGSVSAHAEDYVLTLNDHQFTPNNLEIPANQKVKLTVKNLGKSTAEFESAQLNREKVVEAGSEIIVFVGPLPAGTYNYFDDFHRESTGTITVK